MNLTLLIWPIIWILLQISSCERTVLDRKPCNEPTLESSNCFQLIAEVEEISNELLLQIGLRVDADNSLRKVVISGFKVDAKSMGQLIDAFLQPRPVWNVVSEPHRSNEKNEVLLHRYNEKWDSYYQLLTRLQYPTKGDCQRSYLVVQREECVHPGYSDIRRHYFSDMKNFTHVMGVFVPVRDRSTNHTGFMSPEDCPLATLNRWQCAFLLPTNCSLPADVSTYTSRMPHYYDRADTSAKQLTSFRQLLGANARAQDLHRAVTALSIPHLTYQRPFANISALQHPVQAGQAPDFIFMDFLFRKSAFYRRKVAEALAAFRAKYKLGDSIRTHTRKFVAAHIRRGDRVLAGVDMIQFCANATRPKRPGHVNLCLNTRNHLAPCPDNFHIYGCEKPGDVPIGAVTLEAIADKAALLVGPSIRNLVVFSDDLHWLEAETERLAKSRPAWRVFTLDAPSLARSDQPLFDARREGTSSGVLFQATIALAQQCEALVGHFTSGVALTLTGAMCHRHAGLEGVCPPVYDMKAGL